MVSSARLEPTLTTWYFCFTAVLLLGFDTPDSTESEEYRRLNLQLFLGHPLLVGKVQQPARRNCVRPNRIDVVPCHLGEMVFDPDFSALSVLGTASRFPSLINHFQEIPMHTRFFYKALRSGLQDSFFDSVIPRP